MGTWIQLGHFKLIMATTHWRRSRWYCNTRPTREGSGESPDIPPVSKNQFNILGPMQGPYQILIIYSLIYFQFFFHFCLFSEPREETASVRSFDIQILLINNSFIVPRCISSSAQRSPIYKSIIQWNLIPSSVELSTSFRTLYNNVLKS